MPSSSSRFFPPSSAHIRKRIHVLYRAERQQKNTNLRAVWKEMLLFKFLIFLSSSLLFDPSFMIIYFLDIRCFFFGWWELQAAAQVVSLLILVRELEMEAKKDKRRTAKKKEVAEMHQAK